jgi:uncharacterized protein YlbG (UPF0298 family)
MAAGDTVSELGKTQSVVLYLNTGQVDAKGNQIIKRTTVNGINPAVAEQAKYDFAYALAGLTSKSVEGIDVRTVTELGPIN